MAFWKQKHNQTAGFSLVEVLVAITMLGLVVVPIGSSLVLSAQLNARSDDVLQAQLAVSNAVETLMAEGFDPNVDYSDSFPVDIAGSADEDSNGNTIGYDITVTSNDVPSVSVETYVRACPAEVTDDE